MMTTAINIIYFIIKFFKYFNFVFSEKIYSTLFKAFPDILIEACSEIIVIDPSKFEKGVDVVTFKLQWILFSSIMLEEKVSSISILAFLFDRIDEEILGLPNNQKIKST